MISGLFYAKTAVCFIGDDGRGVYYIVKISDFEAAEASGDLSSLKPVDIYTYDSKDFDLVTGVSDIVTYKTDEPLGTVVIKDTSTYAFWNVRYDELVQTGDDVKTDLEDFGHEGLHYSADGI